jgi:hypothetical protein
VEQPGAMTNKNTGKCNLADVHHRWTDVICRWVVQGQLPAWNEYAKLCFQ